MKKISADSIANNQFIEAENNNIQRQERPPNERTPHVSSRMGLLQAADSLRVLLNLVLQSEREHHVLLP
jgi:hypothetical protein